MNALTKTQEVTPATVEAIEAWCLATTDADSYAFERSVKNKGKRLLDFFQTTGTKPQTATPGDVKKWQDTLRQRELKPATIYNYTSMLSSFYDWALNEEALADALPYGNIASVHRTKPATAYKGAQALTNEEVEELLNVVRYDMEHGKLTARRDYALLLFYILTGHRREEVVRLRWQDVKRTNGTVIVSFLVKGGDYVTEEVNVLCHDALLDYLREAGRLDDMTPDTPLWTRHDRAGKATGQLTSHAFAKNLKRYARDAGLEDIHVHQLRHTVARMVGEDTGDMTAVQKVLGHKNIQTTRVYLRQVSTKKDTHSDAIARRLGL